MTDTADYRREGKVNTPEQIHEYHVRNERREKGICTACGKTAVKGRSYCYSCSEKTKESSMRSLARLLLERHAEMTPEEAIKVLKTRDPAGMNYLIGFFEGIKKQEKPRLFHIVDRLEI